MVGVRRVCGSCVLNDATRRKKQARYPTLPETGDDSVGFVLLRVAICSKRRSWRWGKEDKTSSGREGELSIGVIRPKGASPTQIRKQLPTNTHRQLEQRRVRHKYMPSHQYHSIIGRAGGGGYARSAVNGFALLLHGVAEC